jgi:glycosyltransferase involved in cell wall biosynthesis
VPLDILVVNFFPAFFPPASGGETRLYYLYRELAAHHRVTLVTSTDFGARTEQIAHSPGLREFRFPKDEIWRAAYAAIERAGAFGDLSGLAFALAVADPRCALRQAALQLARNADIVIHDFPYSEPIFRESPPPVEIYNSHNAEVGLLSSLITGPGAERCFQKLLRLERDLIQRARRVFAASLEDGEIFRVFHGLERERLAYCPNGYSEDEMAPLRTARQARRLPHGSRAKLLFIGSQHPPNVEAATWLLELASGLPECDIQIAGAAATKLAAASAPANVTIVGAFDAARKKALIETAEIFLNPVTEGSGTSLKAVEALAAALPMVSTPEGARGLGLTEGEHSVICERAQFPAAIRSLLADRARLDAMAAAGARLAREQFTWPTIAERVSGDLAAVAAAARQAAASAGDVADRSSPPPWGERADKRQPIAVAFNDFPAQPATSGGSARIRGVLGGLGIDVVLIAFGDRCRVELVEPGFVQATIGKSEAHRTFETDINRGRAVSVNDIVASLYCGQNAVLADLLAALVPRAAFAVFEHCYMAPVVDLLRRVAKDLPIVYSAHNLEWRHKDALLRDHPLRSPLVEYTRKIEEKLTQAADLVVACSDADAAYFAARGKKTIVAPNAAAPPLRRPPIEGNSEAAHRVGFLGSGHPPNVAAAQFILRVLAPRFPQASFEFVGGVCEAVSGQKLPANAVLHGIVDAERKSEILSGWSVALNPVDDGGGSSLKLPDYLAHALPVISTSFGGRGFRLAESRAGIIAERGEFAARLREVLGNPRLRRELGDSARTYASGALGWQAAVAPYRNAIEQWVARRPAAKAVRPAMLVVTYRFTEPPLGGAESYLIEVVRQLRAHCRTIDLAAIDLGALVNRHHFAAEYSKEEGGAARVLAECFDTVRLFEPEPPPDDLLERCRRLEQSWRREEREVHRPFAASLTAGGNPALFAGFYPPEDHHGIMRRPTAAAFSVLIPPGMRRLRMTGWTPCRKQLCLAAQPLADAAPGGAAEFRQIIEGAFTCDMALPPETAGGLVLLDCRVEAHTAARDHRELGVYLEAVAGETAIDLERDSDALLRAGDVSGWIDALLRQAAARDAETEAEFALVRGPHSAAMQAWLARQAGRYDAVLVQGVPFAVVPETVETLAGLEPRPRVVVLPHFHADDRFYYWRHYLDAFAEADAALLFSETAAERLKRHGNVAVIPGGGVALEERAGESEIDAFRALCDAARFYLVLGRVTRSKRSERVLRAHAELRAAGAPLDLVLIGPYEDGPEPQGEGVHYLGAQPRGIVLAALSQCLGLVTMSESESFGITICEAWKFKKPVIANAECLAFRELVRHGDSGLLVEGEEQLKAAMHALAADRELAARLGEAGFALVASRYTWRHVAEALAEVLFPAAAKPENAAGFRPKPAAVDHVAE